MKAIIRLAVLAGVVLAASHSFAQTLGVGDPAPKLEVSKWVKGTPVASFAKGKLYVVEFWATWCGPCRESIPHLTEMAKKFKGKVDFVGVSVYEQTPDDYEKKVPAFVEKMGDKMDYNVAADAKSAVAPLWMEAAAQEGIPTSFVVNGDGKIAWIGHPMQLEPVLDEMVAGKWDLDKARKSNQEFLQKEKARKEVEAKRNAVLKDFIAYLRAQDYANAAKELEKAMKDHPKETAGLEMTYLQLLFQTNEDKAYEVATKYSETSIKTDPTALNEIAWIIVSGDTKLSKPDYKLAVKLSKQAVDLTKSKDCMVMDTYAFALFRSGEVKKAIETQEAAIALAKKDERVDSQMMEEFTQRLAMFKKAVK